MQMWPKLNKKLFHSLNVSISFNYFYFTHPTKTKKKLIKL